MNIGFIAHDAKSEALLENTPMQDIERSITLPENADLSECRLVTMLWSSADGMTPLCKAAVFGE